MKRTDRVTYWLIVLSLATCLVPLAAAGTLAAGEPALIGSKACAECHDEMIAKFAGSLHAKAWAAAAKFGTAGCESCHGPGGDHQKDPSRANILSFTKGTKRDAEQLSGQCLTCHAASAAVALWDSGPHRKNGVDCSKCHAIHVAARASCSCRNSPISVRSATTGPGIRAPSTMPRRASAANRRPTASSRDPA